MAKEEVIGVKINGLGPYGITSDKTVLKSPNQTKYELKITNEGKVYTNNFTGDTLVGSADPLTSLSKKAYYKLYINSFFCGGLDADEHTLGYCSHNFVELANLTDYDIDLGASNISLQYSYTSGVWRVLPLKGVIRKGSTFLIRGAQCSVITSPTTKILVDDYDMEWRTDDNWNYSETGNLIKFTNECASFYLTFGTDKPTSSPFYTNLDGKPEVMPYYIDLVGVNGSLNAPYYEANAYKGVKLNERLFKKYYAMDPVKQATKDVSVRDNSKWINYVDLTKEDGEVIPVISDFTPKAVLDFKDIFTDKTKLSNKKPSMITCSFGIQATDNGNGATRCFNWLSKNLNGEYLWYKNVESDSWIRVNQISGEPKYLDEEETQINVRYYYNPKIKEYSDGFVIVGHKCIISGLTAGTYEYIAGHPDKEGNPNEELCTPIHRFTVRRNADVSTVKFIQTSDQQGFNWNEYRVWAATNNVIEKEDDSENPIQFMINTGDMTQNGNRINEWLDYFDAKNDYINNMEEMATIGNNDLSPKILYQLGDGEDASKLSIENIEFFYTFELDPNNPPIFSGITSDNIYIQSLYSFNYGNIHFMCVNSEIAVKAEEDIYGDTGHLLYTKIREWCLNDIENYSGRTTGWNIAYCHEMPFTILTTELTESTVAKDTTTTAMTTYEPSYTSGTYGRNGTKNNGSKLNTLMPTAEQMFWFSDFCQTHNIRLVIGGHKHTQSITWPLLENVYEEDNVRKVMSLRPIIVLSSENFETEIKEVDSNATSLVQLPDGRYYPNTWVENGQIDSAHWAKAKLGEFVVDTALTSSFHNTYVVGSKPVVYAMSQATSYKHTSNKELPSPNNPWARYYFPCGYTKTGDTVNEAQRYPFYTIWTIDNNEIIGSVRKVDGVFEGSSGKFDINIDYAPYVKYGKSATPESHNEDIKSINGINGSVAATSSTVLRIKK